MKLDHLSKICKQRTQMLLLHHLKHFTFMQTDDKIQSKTQHIHRSTDLRKPEVSSRKLRSDYKVSIIVSPEKIRR